MTSLQQIVSSFVSGTPPGELAEVIKSVNTLTGDTSILQKVKPAFVAYNEDQLITTRLPSTGTTKAEFALVSVHNRHPSSPDTYIYSSLQGASSTFCFDHITQKASNTQSYDVATATSQYTQLINSIQAPLQRHFAEHYPPQSTASPTSGQACTVCESSKEPGTIAILISATKSSPNNFLSGRWRTTALYNPSTNILSGSINVQIHYYEDGNVALTGSKTIKDVEIEEDGATIVRKIAVLEKQYQEEVNRSLVAMNEGSFRGLRRQLPVTRQRIEWEKVRGYSLSDNLKGAK